jgi:hypothetical protein
VRLSVSIGELLRQLQKISGKLPKSVFSSYDYPLDRLMNFLAAPEHAFYPELEVTDSGSVLTVDGFLISIRADPSYAPVKFNLDRPVTATEYSVVFPGVIKIVGRLTKNLYLVAPMGQTSRVRVEALRLVS